MPCRAPSRITEYSSVQDGFCRYIFSRNAYEGSDGLIPSLRGWLWRSSRSGGLRRARDCRLSRRVINSLIAVATAARCKPSWHLPDYNTVFSSRGIEIDVVDAPVGPDASFELRPPKCPSPPGRWPPLRCRTAAANVTNVGIYACCELGPTSFDAIVRTLRSKSTICANFRTNPCSTLNIKPRSYRAETPRSAEN